MNLKIKHCNNIYPHHWKIVNGCLVLYEIYMGLSSHKALPFFLSWLLHFFMWWGWCQYWACVSYDTNNVHTNRSYWRLCSELVPHGNSSPSIYIKRCVSPSVCDVLFVPGGQTICLSPGGQTFLTHRREGGQTFCLQVFLQTVLGSTYP